MGYYNVVAPCVVNGRHHVRPSTQPELVDDTVAAPLVAAGSLTPHGKPQANSTFTMADEPSPSDVESGQITYTSETAAVAAAEGVAEALGGEVIEQGKQLYDAGAQWDSAIEEPAEEPAPKPRSRSRKRAED